MIIPLFFGQVTNLNNTFPPVISPVPFIGWDVFGPANPLDFKTELPQPINFYTNEGGGFFNNLRMSIGANGRVGIGNNLIRWGAYTPVQVLDVEGTMNLNTATLCAHGYKNN